MDTDSIEGKAKEAQGKLTGDESREAEGRVQEAWGKTKDKTDEVWEDLKDKAGEAVNEGAERTEAEEKAPR